MAGFVVTFQVMFCRTFAGQDVSLNGFHCKAVSVCSLNTKVLALLSL